MLYIAFNTPNIKKKPGGSRLNFTRLEEDSDLSRDLDFQTQSIHNIPQIHDGAATLPARELLGFISALVLLLFDQPAVLYERSRTRCCLEEQSHQTVVSVCRNWLLEHIVKRISRV